MRGLKTDHGATVVITGHAFVQNIRHGHDELGVEETTTLRVMAALASHQSADEGPSGTLENRNKPGIRGLLHGFWASTWTRSGRPIA